MDLALDYVQHSAHQPEALKPQHIKKNLLSAAHLEIREGVLQEADGALDKAIRVEGLLPGWCFEVLWRLHAQQSALGTYSSKLEGQMACAMGAPWGTVPRC